MGLAAYIAMQTPGGINVINASYIEGSGGDALPLLKRSYNNSGAVADLIAMGNVYDLGRTIEESEFFIRDWNRSKSEEGASRARDVEHLLDALNDGFYAPIYLFRNGQWMVYDPKTGAWEDQ